MATIMCFLLVTSIHFGIAAAAGKFVVLHVSPALHFGRGGTPIEGNILKAVYLASLGFDFDETSDWDEIRLINPLRMPEAAVAVHVEGVSSLGGFDDDARVYPLESYEATTYEQVLLAIAQQQNEPKGKLVNMKLAGERGIRSYSHIFGNQTKNKLPTTDLKYTDKHYYRFERELQTLKAVTASVKSGVIQPDGCSDFYSFKFSSLRNLCINHGPDSKIMLDAKNLLNRQIRELNKAFVSSYNVDVLFTTVITDSVNVLRQRRECGDCAKVCIENRTCACTEEDSIPYHTCIESMDETDPGGGGIPKIPIPLDLPFSNPHVTRCSENLCSCTKKFQNDNCSCACRPSVNCTCPKDTKKNCSAGCVINYCGKRHFPAASTTSIGVHGTTDTAIINIIFFTCTGLYLSLLAVVYTMVTMDPGRDSIIYRMTSAIDRIKME